MNEYTAGNAVQKKYRKLDKLVKRGKEDLEKWKTCPEWQGIYCNSRFHTRSTRRTNRVDGKIV